MKYTQLHPLCSSSYYDSTNNYFEQWDAASYSTFLQHTTNHLYTVHTVVHYKQQVHTYIHTELEWHITLYPLNTTRRDVCTVYLLFMHCLHWCRCMSYVCVCMCICVCVSMYVYVACGACAPSPIQGSKVCMNQLREGMGEEGRILGVGSFFHRL